MQDLNDLILGPRPATLTRAYGINDAGQVVAIGYIGGPPWPFIFRLTPVRAP